MNALAAVDKLDPKECLLAENVRLDETGNILCAGAFTHQNTSAYAAAGGTNTNNIHSLYWNPSLGGVAGVGQDVFQGATLGGLKSKLTAKNTSQTKMSFASAPSRVYFDVGSVGYWSDMTNLLTVDWAPPLSGVLATTQLAGTGTDTQSSGQPWSNPNNITSTGAYATVLLNSDNSQSDPLQASNFGFALNTTSSVQGITVKVDETITQLIGTTTVDVMLMKAGVPVGNIKTFSITSFPTTYILGSPTDLWGATWTSADLNANNFGVLFTVFSAGYGSQQVTTLLRNCNVTVNLAGAGFVAGTGTSGVLTGTYTWVITFVAANGEESDKSPDSVAVTLSAQQGTLTAIPKGDARTTSRNVYRKGGALTSHYLVGSIPNNLATTFSDNQTDLAALTAGVILAGDIPGDYPNSRLGNTQVRFPVLHYDRIFWVNQNQPNQLLWSRPLNGFAYPVINTINVGDSSAVSRIVSIFGELIIFKTNSQIWRLTGTDESSFDLTQTPSAVGTDESFSVVALPDKILFHNRWGFWVFNGYTSQPLTTKLDLWMKQDDRTNEELFGVNGFHPPEVVSLSVPLNFDATGNSEKFYFSYAEAGQPQNNAALVFDVKHGNITKRAFPNNASPLSLAIDPVTGFVYMGDSSGFISLLDDWNGSAQGGAAANFDFQTGYIDLQRGSNKALWLIEFFLDTDGQSLTPSVYYDNGNFSETLAPVSTTSLSRVQRTLESTAARKHQNFSWRLNGSINPVNKNGQPQIQVVHVKVKYDLRAGRAREGQ